MLERPAHTPSITALWQKMPMRTMADPQRLRGWLQLSRSWTTSAQRYSGRSSIATTSWLAQRLPPCSHRRWSCSRAGRRARAGVKLPSKLLPPQEFVSSRDGSTSHCAAVLSLRAGTSLLSQRDFAPSSCFAQPVRRAIVRTCSLQLPEFSHLLRGRCRACSDATRPIARLRKPCASCALSLARARSHGRLSFDLIRSIRAISRRGVCFSTRHGNSTVPRQGC